MTARQKILKAIYPAFMWFTKRSIPAERVYPGKGTKPAISFYTLKYTMIGGQPFDFSQLKGKKVLLVNTASDCGYTGQYDELEKLFLRFNDKLVVIGFPANDFKEQEKGSDEEIARFCKNNYAVSFPLMKKSSVKKGPAQNEVFKWLTEAARNGWNNQQPGWNFSKYLVDEEGRLVNYYAPAVSPLDKSITEAIAN
jgi:glutathione peroxidase